VNVPDVIVIDFVDGETYRGLRVPCVVCAAAPGIVTTTSAAPRAGVLVGAPAVPPGDPACEPPPQPATNAITANAAATEPSGRIERTRMA